MRRLRLSATIAWVTLAMPGIGAQRMAVREPPLGLGIAVVTPQPGQELRFYGEPRLDEQPGDSAPDDVVKFRAALPSVDIAEAPPWLVPQHLKMDYEIFHLRVVTLTPQWLEVVGSIRTAETRWMARTDARFVAWPEFFLGIHSIEAIDAAANPVRARPLDSSPILSTAPAALPPLAVQGDWVKVATHALADRMPPDGWIRWRRGDRLLVTYNPLS